MLHPSSFDPSVGMMVAEWGRVEHSRTVASTARKATLKVGEAAFCSHSITHPLSSATASPGCSGWQAASGQLETSLSGGFSGASGQTSVAASQASASGPPDQVIFRLPGSTLALTLWAPALRSTPGLGDSSLGQQYTEATEATKSGSPPKCPELAARLPLCPEVKGMLRWEDTLPQGGSKQKTVADSLDARWLSKLSLHAPRLHECRCHHKT